MVSLEHWALVAGGSGAAVGGLLAVVTQGPAGLGMYGDIFTGSVLLGLIGGLFFGSGAILLRVLIISLSQRHHQIRIIRLKRLLVVQVPVTQIEAMATRLQKTGAIEVNVRSTTQLREVLELSPTIGQ